MWAFGCCLFDIPFLDCVRSPCVWDGGPPHLCSIPCLRSLGTQGMTSYLAWNIPTHNGRPKGYLFNRTPILWKTLSLPICFPMNNNNSDMARSYGNIIPVLMSCISVDVSRNTMFVNSLLESPTHISKWRRLHRTSVNVSTVAWTWWMRRVGKDCSLPRLAEWRSDFSKCTPDAMRTLRLHNISCQYVAPTFPLDRK